MNKIISFDFFNHLPGTRLFQYCASEVRMLTGEFRYFDDLPIFAKEMLSANRICVEQDGDLGLRVASVLGADATSYSGYVLCLRFINKLQLLQFRARLDAVNKKVRVTPADLQEFVAGLRDEEAPSPAESIYRDIAELLDSRGAKFSELKGEIVSLIERSLPPGPPCA